MLLLESDPFVIILVWHYHACVLLSESRLREFPNALQEQPVVAKVLLYYYEQPVRQVLHVADLLQKEPGRLFLLVHVFLEHVEYAIRVIQAEGTLKQGVQEHLVRSEGFLCAHLVPKGHHQIEFPKVKVHAADVLVSVHIVLDAVFIIQGKDVSLKLFWSECSRV